MRHWNTVAIIGVGLLGASIGLGLRRRGLVHHLVGVGRNARSLEAAQQVGAVDRVTLDIAQGVRDAELIVVCTPVEQVATLATSAAQSCPAAALITDVGSTKAEIVRQLDRSWPREVRFVGSHPLAGSEKRGPLVAEADLFVDRTVVVTPTPNTHPADLAKIDELWSSLGARVVEMDAAEHDRALAATSHLPHLVACALAAAVPEALFSLAAGGLRDTTRIAAGDPEMWTQIMLVNREHLLAALAPLEREVQAFRAALEQADRTRIEQLLTLAKQRRDALGS